MKPSTAPAGASVGRSPRPDTLPAPDAVPTGLVELRIGAVAHGGHCVARYENRVVFVRHALPGELVRARILAGSAGDRFWRADAVEVLDASPDRVTPPCPLAGPGRCGGCDWQHASLPAQRRLKADVVREQLQRLGKVDLDAVPGLADLAVEPVPGDDGGLGWRTRMRFAVDAQGRPALRKHRSHDLVTVPHCPIAHPEVEAVGVEGKPWRGTAAIEVVVAGVGAIEVGVNGDGVNGDGVNGDGVNGDGVNGDGVNGDVVAGVGVPPEVAGGTVQRLVVVEPADGGRVSAPPLGAEASLAVRAPDGLRRLRGRTWVTETVTVEGRARSFRVTGAGFWQVHPGAASTLTRAVLAAADPRPGERALDLYSGVGLFAAALAERVGATGAVLGVESDARAGADARRNLHDLVQVSLETGRVEKLLPGLLASGPWAAPDVVVLDPPRAGAGRAVLESVLRTGPRVVVYVACDPASLGRDVAIAASAGYRLAGVRAFDLFPMTQHVECVATLVPAGTTHSP